MRRRERGGGQGGEREGEEREEREEGERVGDKDAPVEEKVAQTTER